MSKRSYERRIRAKRAAQKAERRRAERMRKFRVGGSIAGAAALATLILVVVLAGGDDRKPTVTPTSTSAAICDTPTPVPTPNDKQFQDPPAMSIDQSKIYLATMITNCGSFKIRMDPRTAPTTVNNLVFLARQQFYNGVRFHRIEDNPGSYAIIQGGDPQGNGQGGPGYDYDGETPPQTARYTRGIVAMAKPEAAFPGQPPQNGSQFFVVVRDWNDLPPEYTIFGQIIDETASFATLNRIVSLKSSGSSAPREPIIILSVTIEELART